MLKSADAGVLGRSPAALGRPAPADVDDGACGGVLGTLA